MSPSFRKLVVTFTKNSSLVLEDIRNLIQLKYNVQYIGIFETEFDKKVYVQLKSNAQMAPNTLKKQLTSVGEIKGLPINFSTMEGTLLESFGEFSKRGRKYGSKVINSKVINDNSVVNNNIDNSTHNDNSIHNDNSTVINDNRVIHLHIHPLGEEDVTHITPERLISLLKSEKDLKVMIAERHTEEARHEYMTVEMGKDLRRRRNLVRKWDELNSNGKNTLAESLDIEEMTTESEKDYNAIEEVPEEPPTYDPDWDCAENLSKMRELLTDLCFQLERDQFKTEFIDNYEKLMYNNPHNGNVLASTTKGTFKYFDGTDWLTFDKTDYFEKISRYRFEKAVCSLNGSMEEGTPYNLAQNHIRKMLDRLDGLRDIHPEYKKVVKNSVILSENHNRKLKRSSKCIKRVHEEVPKKYSWEDILS